MDEVNTNQLMSSKLNQLEAVLTEYPKVDLPIVHRLTPGMYIREILIPAGTMLTSMEHRTEHPFVISQGRIVVTSENEGQVIYEAPHTGITKPGTKRALFAETDVIWTTFHATEETDIEKICESLLVPQHNPLIENGKQQEQWRDSLPTKQLCHS